MDALASLLDALRCLPGVGPKTAQRMMYKLLEQPHRIKGLQLAACLEAAMRETTCCTSCNNYTTTPLCKLCTRPHRDPSLLCVVENPADLLAIEQTHAYQGYYYVLMGKISPIDGIGPEQIALAGLTQRAQDPMISEIILALSPSIEGQTTVHFIREYLQPYNKSITQLAHGLPSCGELEYLDGRTIGQALRHRGVF